MGWSLGGIVGNFFGGYDEPGRSAGVDVSASSGRAISDETLRIGREALQTQKDRAAAFDPRYTEALDLARDATRRAADRSIDQHGRYDASFAPLEERVARDAMEYDSPEAIERAAQEAESGVAKSFSTTRDIGRRNLSRMSINPASGAYREGLEDVGVDEAAARALASNTAREGRRTGGIALRSNAANLGRAISAGASANDQLALGGSGATIAGTNAAIAAPGAAINQALPWFTTAVGANEGAGKLDLGQFSTITDNETKRRGQNIDVLSDVGGTVASMASTFFSSEKLKTDKEPVDESMILEGLESIPVEQWRYKAGGGKHVGPYAEDVQRQFGNKAAPGGEMIDAVTMNGILLAGVKELAKKVKKLEGGDGMHMARGIKRPTEPRRSA